MPSAFAEKLLRGELPSAAEWAEHLQQVHGEAPGMTSRAFAAQVDAHGKSSYQVLAETLGPQSLEGCVVDLACGDGHLIRHLLPRLGPKGRVVGVDMSEGELAVARRAFDEPRVQFQRAQAQALPVAAGSVDAVLCHLAFMLMVPVEPVVQELARVLVPGGSFAAVVDRRAAPENLLGALQQLIGAFVAERHPGMQKAPTGDPRTQTEAGLHELFHPETGFESAIELLDFEIPMRFTPPELWAFLADTYFVGMLPEAEKAELRERILEVGARRADRAGRALLEMPLRRLVVRRAQAPR